ncbi:MAG: hypothetical protein HYV96_13445 [Opitutae bacterium]|nr:hypothetical protein [Opitutae bacterium]
MNPIKSAFWSSREPDPVFVGRSLNRALAKATQLDDIAHSPAVSFETMCRLYVFSATSAVLLTQHIVGRHYQNCPAQENHASFFNSVSDEIRQCVSQANLPALAVSAAFVHESQRLAAIEILRARGAAVTIDSGLPAELIYSLNRMFLARDFTLMLQDANLQDCNISIGTVGRLGRFVHAFVCTGAWSPTERMPKVVDEKIGEFGAYLCGSIRAIIDANPFR